MTVGAILTLGIGGYSDINHVVTLGYTPSAAAVYAKNAALYYDIGSNLSIMLGVPRFSSWNTAGRPASPKLYSFGFNIDTGQLEMWNGSAWKGVLLS